MLQVLSPAGEEVLSLVRIRYIFLNSGNYACVVLSLLPLPPSMYLAASQLPAPITPVTAPPLPPVLPGPAPATRSAFEVPRALGLPPVGLSPRPPPELTYPQPMPALAPPVFTQPVRAPRPVFDIQISRPARPPVMQWVVGHFEPPSPLPPHASPSSQAWSQPLDELAPTVPVLPSFLDSTAHPSVWSCMQPGVVGPSSHSFVSHARRLSDDITGDGTETGNELEQLLAPLPVPLEASLGEEAVVIKAEAVDLDESASPWSMPARHATETSHAANPKQPASLTLTPDREDALEAFLFGEEAGISLDIIQQLADLEDFDILDLDSRSHETAQPFRPWRASCEPPTGSRHPPASNST
jgi:hypothetical protein